VLTPLDNTVQVQRSDQVYYPRTLSLSATSRDSRFRNQVRDRDRRCVISGQVIPERDIQDGYWGGLQAAHIFPLALDHLFNSLGYNNLITHNVPPGVNSPQNGILLRSDLHEYWVCYAFTVNPDNGYAIQSFRESAWPYHGHILHPGCRQQGSPLRVLDPLLRWHFEQAVLFNMRGAAEQVFEFDFPPGTDMMGEIRAGPRAAERMEAELFNRLYGWREVQSLEHDRTSPALTSC